MPSGVYDRKKKPEAAPVVATTKGSKGAPPPPPPQSGVLCPGVRLVPGYEASEKGRGRDKGVGSAAASKAGSTKRKRGDSDDESCGGYGPEIQTLAKDIAHLQKLFPGEFCVETAPPPYPPLPLPSAQRARALLSVGLACTGPQP